MVTSFFVKIAEQLESRSFLVERRLALLRFIYAWDCVDVYGNIWKWMWTESVCLIIEFPGRWTLLPVVVGPGFFKIMVSWTLI